MLKNLLQYLKKTTGIKFDVTEKDIFISNSVKINIKGQILAISFTGIKIDHFKKIIDQLIGIETLETFLMANCEIDDISSIQYLTHLKTLHIEDVIFKDLSIVQSLKKLETLTIIESELSNVEIIGELKELKSLNLSVNNISDITPIAGLKNLNFLWLYNNKLSDISPLKSLKKLKNLGLGKNQIKNFEVIKELKNIRELQLIDNSLEDISFLEPCPYIRNLYLSSNKIKSIVPLSTFKKLNSLDIHDNILKSVPHWIVNNNLDIHYGERYSRNGIGLGGNPLIDPPVEIVKQGTDAVKAWFTGERVFVDEVKVLLVGHGEVGKTTLVKSLTGQKPDPNENATHHINISSYNIEYNEKNVKLNFWDFGGQEVMHSTHQFFLSKRSIYLLLLDGRRDEDAEYWLKHIESFGGNSPVLIVLNKIDTNPAFDVDRRFLTQKYPFIIGFYKTVCIGTPSGLDELMKGITDALEKVEVLSAPWPKSWVAVKEALEKMSDDFISQDNYEKLCENNKISDSTSKEVLAGYLNDLGVVVHFKDLRLSDLHILQPRWASRAAYKIINSKKVADNQGLLKVDWLNEIMKKEDENDFSYKPNTFSYILDLMQKFELCFTISETSSFLIPELMSIQQPVLPQHRGPTLKFFLKYEDLLPKSIMARFMVRMHEDISSNTSWRTGVVLEVPIFNSLAIVIADVKERKIDISVSGRNRREHFALIRKAFNSLNRDFEKLVVSEWIPLPDSDIAVEYDELIGYEDAGKKEYFVGKLKKEFMVKNLLDGIEPENIRKNNYTWDVFLCHSSIDKPLVRKIIKDLKKRGISYWIDEEQISPGDYSIDKITEGLQGSRVIMPLISANQLNSGWSRNEYQSILTRIISGSSKQRITPLVLDETLDEQLPLFLSTLRHERYNKPSEYKRLLNYLDNELPF